MIEDILEGLMLFFFGWDWSDPIDVFFALSIYISGSIVLVAKWIDLVKWIAKRVKPRR